MNIVLPTVSVVCIVVSAILVGFGWRSVLKGHRALHQKQMTLAALFALAFFMIYVSRTLFVGNTDFDGPENAELYYRIFLLFHILLSTSAAVFGAVTLYTGWKGSYIRHRKLGRITAVAWLITAVTGVAVYILLYILYPGGETKPMIDAIFG